MGRVDGVQLCLIRGSFFFELLTKRVLQVDRRAAYAHSLREAHARLVVIKNMVLPADVVRAAKGFGASDSNFDPLRNVYDTSRIPVLSPTTKTHTLSQDN